MVVYGTSGLTSRSQARELLALAAQEVWGLTPLPEIFRRAGGKPFFPERGDLHGPGWAAAVCGHTAPPEKIVERGLGVPSV